MSDPAITDLTRPLYSYCPEYLHTWLDQIKEDTELTKSDTVNLLLEIARANFTAEQIEKLYNDFVLLGQKGIQVEWKQISIK